MDIPRGSDKTELMQKIELEHGRPLEDVILDLYEEHGDFDSVATALGISRNTLWMWLKMRGIGARHIRIAVLQRKHDRNQQPGLPLNGHDKARDEVLPETVQAPRVEA